MKRLLILALVLIFFGCAGQTPYDSTGQKFGPPGVTLWKVQNGLIAPVADKAVRTRIPVLDVSSNTTLTASQMKGYRISLTGDGTVLTLADTDEMNAGDCIYVRCADATAKGIDVTSDDADNFELNGVDMTASYQISLAAGNQGKAIQICFDVAGSNELIAKGDLEYTDSGGD